ncbi:GntR family transcriptional regulator [Rhizomonospora bruguierae]|uniref:GntR family transcriptional regulator n=1 Tax=Rhizomonospora bruguierae TaxID=1581705 RepID=UPI0024BDD572|nr:GntR family transcriptional regulator [Micromonospora sp. NBRC 107566]
MAGIARLITIDRFSPVPLYFQVATGLERLIESGRLPPGSRLDTEVTLADGLGLSRPTLRQAIQHLVDKGLVVRKRGVGTQVVRSAVRRRVDLTSLHDDLRRAHRKPRTEVLAFDVAEVPDDVAPALHLGPRAEVLSIRRLRYAEDEPLALMHNYVPADVAPITAERLRAAGLYQVLRESGVQLRIADQAIGARKATAAEARLLGTARGAPLLTMQRTAYDHAGRAVEYGSHLYRSDRYSFEVTLVAR